MRNRVINHKYINLFNCCYCLFGDVIELFIAKIRQISCELDKYIIMSLDINNNHA